MALQRHSTKGRSVVVHSSRPHGALPRAQIHLQSSPTIQMARRGTSTLSSTHHISHTRVTNKQSQLYPPLFDRVKEKVMEGKFHLVGGAWVENDANMPSGEALIRQFLYGQRYFETRFGRRCDTAWLPDSFGLTGSLPQLIRGAGMKYFFTQKLSW